MREIHIQVCDICVSYRDIEIKGYINNEYNLINIEDDGCINISPETNYGNQPYTDLLLQVDIVDGVQSVVPNKVINTLVDEDGDVLHTYINMSKDNNSTIVGYTTEVAREECGTDSSVSHERNRVILFVKKEDELYEHIFREDSVCDYCCNIYCNYTVKEVKSLPKDLIKCDYPVSTGIDDKFLFTLHRDTYDGEFILMSGDTEILRYSDNKGDEYYPYGFVKLVIEGGVVVSKYNSEFKLISNYCIGGTAHLGVEFEEGNLQSIKVLTNGGVISTDYVECSDIEEFDCKAYLDSSGLVTKLTDSNFLRNYENIIMVDLSKDEEPNAEIIGCAEYSYDTSLNSQDIGSKAEVLALYVVKGNQLTEHTFTKHDSLTYSDSFRCSYNTNETRKVANNMVELNIPIYINEDDSLVFGKNNNVYYLFAQDKCILEYSYDKGNYEHPQGFVKLNIKGDE